MSDGSRNTLGIGEALRQSHQIDRLAVDDPISSYGLRRFLNALVWVVYAYDKDHNWEDVAAGEAPLPARAVETTIKRFRPHCWLLHPDTPFLQIPELRHAATKKGKTPEDITFPFGSLHSHVPSGSNEAWWYRDVNSSDVSPSQAALGLLARHIGATPGNETDIKTSDGKTFRRSDGGLLLAGPRDVTHVWWDGTNLASQMITSLRAADAATLTEDHRTFIEDPTAGAVRIDDPIYRYTYSGSTRLGV